jgi:hypothetical protein
MNKHGSEKQRKLPLLYLIIFSNWPSSLLFTILMIFNRKVMISFFLVVCSHCLCLVLLTLQSTLSETQLSLSASIMILTTQFLIPFCAISFILQVNATPITSENNSSAIVPNSTTTETKHIIEDIIAAIDDHKHDK